MAKSEYADLTYFMIYGYKLVKNSDTLATLTLLSREGIPLAQYLGKAF